MKHKILNFLKETQKATAALLGAASVLGTATFLPAPWGHYVALATVVLTWLATYCLPYVSKAVESFPDDESASGPEPLTGEIIEPATAEIPVAVSIDTAGIPVIEGPSDPNWSPPFTGALRVEDVLARLTAERVIV